MKINVLLDKDNVIQAWRSEPLLDDMLIIECEDPSLIHIGYSKYNVNTKHIILNNNVFNKMVHREELYFRIQELKDNLSATDYKLTKYLEGELTEEEFLPIKAQRKQWREEINSLEEELNGEQ